MFAIYGVDASFTIPCFSRIPFVFFPLLVFYTYISLHPIDHANVYMCVTKTVENLVLIKEQKRFCCLGILKGHDFSVMYVQNSLSFTLQQLSYSIVSMS